MLGFEIRHAATIPVNRLGALELHPTFFAPSVPSIMFLTHFAIMKRSNPPRAIFFSLASGGKNSSYSGTIAFAVLAIGTE